MIYLMLALLTYLLFQIPRLTTDLPYVQYQPKNAVIAERDRQVINRATLWFVLAFLILFAGLRDYRIGWDLSWFYTAAWNRLVESGGSNLSYEWLYAGLMWVCYFIFGAKYGLTFVLLICAAIIVLSVYFAGRMMLPKEVGLVMFFMVACTLYLRGFSTIRQCTAVGFCVLATAAIYRNANWKTILLFVLCLVLASGFHLPTAVFFLPMAMFFFLKSDFWQILVWAEALFLGLVFLHFDDKIVQIFGRITGKMYYYNFYLAGGYGIFDWNPIDAIEFTLAMLGLVGFVAYKLWYRWHYKQRVNRAYDLCLNIYFFGALFYFLAFISSQFYVYERLTLPFTWASICLVTNILGNIQNKRVRIIIQSVAMVAALAYTLALVFLGKHAIYPYYFIGS